MNLLQLILTGVSQGCIYALVALGFVLIYKATEIVNFAQGDLLMLGAFLGVTFIGYLGLPYWLGIALSVLSMAEIGYLIDVAILRRVIGQPQFVLAILPISLGFVLRALAGAIWGGEPQVFDTPFTGKLLRLGDAIIAYEQIAVIVGTILLAALLYVFFTYTRLGVAMQAASQNQLAAYYMSIPVKRLFSLIFAISSGVAAIAGLLLAPISLVDPQLGFIGIKAFAAAVIGGFMNLPGVVMGGLLVGVAEQVAAVYLPDWFKAMTPYLLMLVVLAFRPEGLFSRTQRKKV